jgi:outer membrane protein OmpA-like peptidoglycan-associated protein
MLEVMRAVLVVVIVAALARVATANPPSGYACAPGTAKKGIGCACPAGYAEIRDDDNLAMCAESRPKLPPGEEELARRECPTVEAALVKAFGAGLKDDEQKKFKAGFGAAVVKRCTRAVWHKEGRKCLAAAVTGEAAFECIEKLPPVERTGLEADAARTYPVGAELDKTQIRARGPIVFATTTETMSEASRPQVNAVAQVMLANPTVRIEVQVYSDAAGSEKLSLSRANTVREALITAGVPVPRLAVKGAGAALPIASNDSAWGRARNRRVVFAIVTKPDRDRDGIPDDVDRCPDQAETYNGFQDDDGCVDTPPRMIEKGAALKIPERILFEPTSARITPVARPMLDAVIAALKGEPTVSVRVIGHADKTEGAVDPLSKQRATEVVDFLAQAGIARNRMDIVGVGANAPAADSSTAAGREKNRFVEFETFVRK